MKRNYCLSLVLLALFGVSAPFAANAAVESVLSSQSTQQAKKITGFRCGRRTHHRRQRVSKRFWYRRCDGY